MTLTWPTRSNCSNITVKNYLSAKDKSWNEHQEDKPYSKKEITDELMINNIFEHLSDLSPNGEEMKSFADNIDLLTLDFVYPNKSESIEIYGGQVKTPSTGFVMEKDDQNKEMVFVNLVRSLL